MLTREENGFIPVDMNLTHRDENLLTSGASVLIKAHDLKFSWHVLDTGSELPVMVLLHGSSTTKSLWRDTIAHFTPEYRIVAVDFPGHGLSTKVSDFLELSAVEKDILAADVYNPLSLTKQLQQVFAQKHLRGVYVLGWGLGAHLAYALSACDPDTISKIVAVDAPPVRFSPAGLAEGFTAWFAKELVGEWINKPAHISWDAAADIARNLDADNDAVFISDLMHTDPLLRKHLFAGGEKHEHEFYDVLDGKQWAMTTNMALLLMSSNGNVVNGKYLLSLAGLLKNKESAVVVEENATHLVFKKDPAGFYNRVSAFFKPQPKSPVSPNVLQHSPAELRK